jgi:hypothetical protein
VQFCGFRFGGGRTAAELATDSALVSTLLNPVETMTKTF